MNINPAVLSLGHDDNKITCYFLKVFFRTNRLDKIMLGRRDLHFHHKDLRVCNEISIHVIEYNENSEVTLNFLFTKELVCLNFFRFRNSFAAGVNDILFKDGITYHVTI